jgi:hypothetical protein
MKTRLFTIFGTLAILLTIAHFFEKPILAQIRAALVQNVDEPGRNSLTLHADTASGPFTSFTAPAGKIYVIEAFTISCDVDSTTYMTDLSLYTSSDGVQFQSSATPHLVQPNGSVSSHAVNSWRGSGLTRVYASAGSTISMRAFDATQGLGVRDCHFSISGYTVSAP